MVRLICDTRMRIGSLLLRAGVASEPMSEEDAERLIAKDPLARLWRGGPLQIIPADQVEQDAEAAQRAREERIDVAARAAFDALKSAEDPSAAKARLDELWGRDQPVTAAAVVSAVDAVVFAMTNAQSMLESLSPEERELAMAGAEERFRAATGGTGAGDDQGAEGTEDSGEDGEAPPVPPVPLDKLTIPQATPVIAQETDLDALQAWREFDDRKGIHELIDARLDELTRPE